MKRKQIIIPGLLLLLLFFGTETLEAITVASNLCQEKAFEPGKTYSDVIKLMNREKKPAEVKFYQTDYRYFSDGTNQFGEPGKAPRSNALWISGLPEQITLAPGETSLIPYSVTVPDDASLSGSYWSMIMVEQIDQRELEMMASGERQTGIRQLTRYGIQVVTHIGGTGTRQLEFRNLKLVKGNDRRVLRIDVANAGTRALKTLLWMDLYAENGGYAKKINGVQRNIFPECGVMQELDLKDIPPGDYKAVVVADAGEETVFGTSFNFQLKE